ncbi:MAG: MBL fold metallo-hydrolase [Chloroflexota bacterium]
MTSRIVTTDWTWRPDIAATPLAPGLWQLDLGFQGRSGVIAAYLLAGSGELALVETGPSTTLPALEAGITAAGFNLAELTHVLLTHIHLDHAGAAGPLARANATLQVHVHPIGAPHLVDPSRLIASATRIYGDQMGPLWGEVAPIPPEQVHPFTDDATLTVAGRRLHVRFTPGHASHHVAIFDEATGGIFTGDVGGIRMPGTTYVCPPTPPPDLDPDAWRASVACLRAWPARRLYLTHFGAYDDVREHLDRLLAELDQFLAIGKEMIEPAPDRVDQAALTARIHQRMADQLGPVPEDLLTNLEWATPSYMAALGLTRLFTRRR